MAQYNLTTNKSFIKVVPEICLFSQPLPLAPIQPSDDLHTKETSFELLRMPPGWLPDLLFGRSHFLRPLCPIIIYRCWYPLKLAICWVLEDCPGRVDGRTFMGYFQNQIKQAFQRWTSASCLPPPHTDQSFFFCGFRLLFFFFFKTCFGTIFFNDY